VRALSRYREVVERHSFRNNLTEVHVAVVCFVAGGNVTTSHITMPALAVRISVYDVSGCVTGYHFPFAFRDSIFTPNIIMRTRQFLLLVIGWLSLASCSSLKPLPTVKHSEEPFVKLKNTRTFDTAKASAAIVSVWRRTECCYL
jgi:hypothetical protein